MVDRRLDDVVEFWPRLHGLVYGLVIEHLTFTVCRNPGEKRSWRKSIVVSFIHVDGAPRGFTGGTEARRCGPSQAEWNEIPW